LFISSDKQTISDWFTKGLKIPKEWKEKEEGAAEIVFEENHTGDLIDYPFFVLVDTGRVIRNYYHINKIKDVERLAQHISLIIPRDVERDAIFKPETEK